MYFNPILRKFYTSIDVAFFESLPYFAPIASLIPQPMPSFGDLEKEIVPKLLQVYTELSKDVVSTHSLLIQSLHLLILILILLLCLLILHFLLLRWIFLLLLTWIFLLHIKRVNDLVLNILFLITFLMIILPHYLVSLLCLFLQFLCLSLIKEH